MSRKPFIAGNWKMNKNPEEAKEGTIRKLYATNNRENCVHASDSIESAKREIKLWFGDSNL